MKKVLFGSIGLLLLMFCGVFLLSCSELTDDSGGGGTGELVLVNVAPTSVSLSVGQTQLFSATAVYSNGTSSDVSASWSVTGDIGSIESIGLNALFTATTSGSGTVIGTYNSKSGIASVTVTGEATPEAGELVTIEVWPANVKLKVGQSTYFSAAGKDSSNEAVPIMPTWTISGDAIGILKTTSTEATLEAKSEGSAYIKVVSGEVVGTAHVTVEGYYVEITAEVDTYVDSSDGTPHGSAITLVAGRVTDPSEKIYETYIKFDVAAISASASIESATLKVYASDTDSTSMKIGRLGESWTAAVTWESKPTIESFVSSHTFSAGSNSIGIKDLVQHWVSVVNNGLAIYKDAPAIGYVNLVSVDDTSTEERRPKLVIEYYTP